MSPSLRLFSPALLAVTLLAKPALLILTGSGPIFGQSGPPVYLAEDESESEDAQSPDEPEAAADAEENAGSSAGSGQSDRHSRRLQMISKLVFDRKPSAILKAWNEPAPNPPVLAPASAQRPANVTTAKPEGKTAPAASTSKTPAKGDAAGPGKKEDAKKEDAAETAKKAELAKKEQEAQKAEEARLKTVEDAIFQFELTMLQRQVTLSQWNQVRDFIASLEMDEAKPLYAQIVTSLHSGSTGRMNVDPSVLQQLVSDGADILAIQQALSSIGQGPGAAYLEKNLFTMPDFLGLLSIAPCEYEEDWIRKLGMILQFTINTGFDLDALLAMPAMTQAKSGLKVVILEPLPPVTEKPPVADGNSKKDEADKGSSEKLPRPPYQIMARDLARLLCAARQEIPAGDFLPSIEEAIEASDGAGLNLIVKHVLRKYTEEQKSVGLEHAWRATQAVLEFPLPQEPAEEVKAAATGTSSSSTPSTADGAAATKNNGAKASSKESSLEKARLRYRQAKANRTEALTMAVELAPKIRKELGQQWLDDSFQKRLERGKELLTAIGSATSSNLSSRPNDSEFRKKGLELQKTAIDSLLRASNAAHGRAAGPTAEWSEPLTVMAVAWLKEATTSHALDNSAGMRGWRRDRYGNYFMDDDDDMPMQMRYGGQSASPIKIEDMLELEPSIVWLDLISRDLRPKFDEMIARLHLKVQDEAAAFPFIERLAQTHPKRAKGLAEEFVKVWTSTHNPNEKRDGYNPFYYYWGYERRADRIPLTRSKQERNLVELADWVRKIKALPIEEIKETLLTNAFTTAHSRAEVYRIEAIESVFGSLDALKPRTLAELIQQMRGNLATVWRMPDVQRQNSTNRKQRDIRAEVMRGYEVSRDVVRRALERHPDHWALILADAAVLHDELEYGKEFEKSSDFSERRGQAFDLFAKAASAYAKAVPDIPLDEQTVLPYEMWFYASLGSVDLARVTADKSPDLRQPALIKQALAEIHGEAAERHLSQFANNLFTRASDAKPELKQRYLKAGFEVVGSHKLAREARKLYDYYQDLVTEIKLESRVDGSDSVGHGKPFGVFVNLVHTKEIERESGGFGKYLQNQQNQQMFFYNFGRPLENYRDKFRDFATKALGEHFEVMSVTFQEASVNSRALPEYGWRMTPYAYLLLKAKGPEVDKLAPLRLDFDFLDTSGYAVLPVETPIVPIDARADTPPQRPATEIVVTQTLDERQADKGKLLLEVRATARGLVPEFDQLLELKPDGFKVEKVDDRGLAVLEFDKDATDNAVRSERQWMVSLVATHGEKTPAAFRFADARLPVKEQIYQRYVDADLKAVPMEVSLESKYGESSWWMWGLPLAGLIAGLAAAIGLWKAFGRQTAGSPSQFELPSSLTPFTVIGFLRELEARAGFDDETRRRLAETVAAIEHHYFDSPLSSPPDVTSIAQEWLTIAIKPR